MKRILTLAAGGVLAAGLVATAGCQPHNSSASSNPPVNSDQTAGGNGAFGESPANPGERSEQRFQNATHVPTTQPGQ